MFLKGVELEVGKKYWIDNEMYVLEHIAQSAYSFNVFHNPSNGCKSVFSNDYLMKHDFSKVEIPFTLNEEAMKAVNASYLTKLSNQFGLDTPYFAKMATHKETNLPRKVIFNDKKKATTLLFGDEATVVKACKGDKYDREKGFLMAFFQKQSGLSKTQAKKYLKEITTKE